MATFTCIVHTLFILIAHLKVTFPASIPPSQSAFGISNHQRGVNVKMADQNRANEKLWFPLESNPALLNQYISKLGFNILSNEFTDVFSTEQWALDMVPQPVSAVVVLFPMTEKILCKRRELHLHSESEISKDENVWYIKQRIRNACGTIAILHALANTPKAIQDSSIGSSSWLHSFLHKCPASTSPTEKAEALENDQTIETFHEDATNDSSNQTSRGSKEDNIDLHFVSIVHVNGKLYELDGRVDIGPICHGSTTQQSLLKDACGIVKKMMDADPTELRFTIIALAPKT